MCVKGIIIIVAALSIGEISESFQEKEVFEKSCHMTEFILILNLGTIWLF